MYIKKIGRCLKLLVPKYHSHPLNNLGDIPEKVYSAKLKPIVMVAIPHLSHSKIRGDVAGGMIEHVSSMCAKKGRNASAARQKFVRRPPETLKLKKIFDNFILFDPFQNAVVDIRGATYLGAGSLIKFGPMFPFPSLKRPWRRPDRIGNCIHVR